MSFSIQPELIWIDNFPVNPSFRNQIFSKFPNLTNSIGHQRLLCILLFGTFLDKDSGGHVVTADLMAALYDQIKSHEQKNFCACDYFEKFDHEVWPINYSDWRYMDKKARTVTLENFPPEIYVLVNKEMADDSNLQDKVGFVTGKRLTAPYTAGISQKADDKVDAICNKLAHFPLQLELLQYLNHLPKRLFREVLNRNSKLIEEVISKLPPSKRGKQQAILRSIQFYPRPLYKPVAHSSRIYPANPNFACLKREIRHAALHGWLEFDMSNAQLAIAAKVWNLPEITKYLDDGGKMWQHLADVLGVEKNEENKRTIKDSLYALMFGAGEKKMIEDLSLFGEEAVRRFMKDGYIRELLFARRMRMKQIKITGGITTCYGEVILFDKRYGHRRKSIRSLLAQEMQSYEFKLLEFAILAAKESQHDTKGFRIALWQHDGITVVPNDSRYGDVVQEKLSEVMYIVVRQMGVSTFFVRS